MDEVKDTAAVNETAGTTETTTEVATIKTEIECPHCHNKIVIESPAPQRRGQLAGLDIADMTDEQLKREKINSSSVLYKAKKRGASAETVAKNQARVDAVNAELAKRAAAKAPVVTATEATTEAPVENKELAGEI